MLIPIKEEKKFTFSIFPIFHVNRKLSLSNLFTENKPQIEHLAWKTNILDGKW